MKSTWDVQLQLLVIVSRLCRPIRPRNTIVSIVGATSIVAVIDEGVSKFAIAETSTKAVAYSQSAFPWTFSVFQQECLHVMMKPGRTSPKWPILCPSETWKPVTQTRYRFERCFPIETALASHFTTRTATDWWHSRSREAQLDIPTELRWTGASDGLRLNSCASLSLQQRRLNTADQNHRLTVNIASSPSSLLASPRTLSLGPQSADQTPNLDWLGPINSNANPPDCRTKIWIAVVKMANRILSVLSFIFVRPTLYCRKFLQYAYYWCITYIAAYDVRVCCRSCCDMFYRKFRYLDWQKRVY